MSDPNENIKNVDASTTKTKLPETDDLIERLKAAIFPNCDTANPDAAGKILKEIMLKSDEELLAEALRICGGTDPGKNIFASTDSSEVTDVVWGDLFLVYPLQIAKVVEGQLGGGKDESFESDENFEDENPEPAEEDKCAVLLAAIRAWYYDDMAFYLLSKAIEAAIIGGKKADNEEE